MKIRKKYISEFGKFYSQNKSIIIITIFCLITIICTIGANWSEVPSTLYKWVNLANAIAIGFIINFMFFIGQVYYPKRKKEIDAFNIIRPYIETIYRATLEVSEVLCNIYVIKDSVIRPLYKGKTIYYIINVNGVEVGTSRKPEEIFLEQSKMLHNAIISIESQEIFSDCEDEIKAIIAKLRCLNFEETLISIHENQEIVGECVYYDLQEEYSTLKDICQQLRKILDDKSVYRLRIMSKYEVDNYSKMKRSVDYLCKER